MSRYQEIQKLNNVTIINAPDGRFGIKDSSNSIVLAPKYDFIAPLIDIDGDNRYLQIKKNGLIGIYDSVRVDFKCNCKMNQIIEVSQKKIKGKEPIFKYSFLRRVPFLHWNTEIDLE